VSLHSGWDPSKKWLGGLSVLTDCKRQSVHGVCISFWALDKNPEEVDLIISFSLA